MAFRSDLATDGNWSDYFKEGERFYLLEARLGAIVTTQFGTAQTGILTCRVDGSGDLRLSIIGDPIINAIQQLEPGDLPEWCVIKMVPTNSGRTAKILDKWIDPGQTPLPTPTATGGNGDDGSSVPF